MLLPARRSRPRPLCPSGLPGRQLEAEAAHPAPARGRWKLKASWLEVETLHPASARAVVEAEGCGSWEYNEGVGGQYTCAGCGARPFRSAFLIEATDLEGNLCVERDLEGRLYGRCYDCCRGRGRQGGLDIYAHLVPETSLLTEEMLAKIFKKECNRRHLKRSGVKNKRLCAAETTSTADSLPPPRLRVLQIGGEIVEGLREARRPPPLRGAAADRPALQGGQAHPGR